MRERLTEQAASPFPLICATVTLMGCRLLATLPQSPASLTCQPCCSLLMISAAAHRIFIIDCHFTPAARAYMMPPRLRRRRHEYRHAVAPMRGSRFHIARVYIFAPFRPPSLRHRRRSLHAGRRHAYSRGCARRELAFRACRRQRACHAAAARMPRGRRRPAPRRRGSWRIAAAAIRARADEFISLARRARLRRARLPPL